ncbi:Pentatricopeptide repeat-containing protein [Artemisia annua]|uniref:Pentatricopeptide repeat-containing protein n=1 Tax=Artemisia annua TaxID=35608 RepID=A0A2U1L8X0_ARTAN|nr:Pentatricopeptide repeat-containing protein [Artemisia annua]
MVTGYVKSGEVGKARVLFDEMVERDIGGRPDEVTLVTVLSACVDGLGRWNRDAYKTPTDISFIGILSACAHTGLLSIEKVIFLLMKREYMIEPTIEHYGCMVNLLGRAGYLEEPYGLVKNMKVNPDPVIWGTLLDSYSNILANSDTYIILSNLYSATSNWDGVARMRTMIKDHGVLKEPGCSSIEVHNKVHEFLAGDMKHPNSNKIYMMLDEVKDIGYSIVLHDFGNKERVRSLEVHSEKLAVAFGLINTEAGSSIKIVKNLRICLDCHEVMKLISKITRPRIVIRDRNRFHHFVDAFLSFPHHFPNESTIGKVGRCGGELQRASTWDSARQFAATLNALSNTSESPTVGLLSSLDSFLEYDSK